MAYARFGENCDVYVYESVHGGFVCCGCFLADRPFAGHVEEDRYAMWQHLHEHRRQGHQVPQAALDRLEREAAETEGW